MAPHATIKSQALSSIDKAECFPFTVGIVKQ